MGEGDLIDILLLGALAAFVVFRLRSVLGRRTGEEPAPPRDPFGPRPGAEDEAESGKVVRLPQRDDAPAAQDAPAPEPIAEDPPPSGPLAEGVAAVRAADPSFDPDGFLQGARGAFEMIVSAFADGDRKTLRPLLSDDVFSDFARAIDERDERGERLETNFVGFRSVELVEADVTGKTAFVTVLFTSEQVNLLRDEEDRILEGDPNEVETIEDRWTFARNIRARDPNWTLVSTESGEDAEPASTDD